MKHRMQAVPFYFGVAMRLFSFYQKLLAIAILCFGVSGCIINSADDDVSSGSDNASFLSGKNLFKEKCANCHGDDGGGGSGGPSLIACATCNAGSETLINKISQSMPLSNADDCGQSCATDIATYILDGFNNDESQDLTPFFSKAVLLDSQQTLRKASLNLLGRLPTKAEIQQVEEFDLTGLDTALEEMMTEEAFFTRLTELFNDVLHQNKYLPGEAAINLLTDSEYQNRRWYRELNLCTSNCLTDEEKSQQQRFSRLLNAANDALAQEVYHLINYVVRNKRPLSEILTADYTMVNYYSARIYGIEEQYDFTLLTPTDDNYPSDTLLLNDGLYIQDPKDFRPAIVKNIPHAGILTSPMFLNRFPTTETNRNRHRSRMVQAIFLDTDILAISGTRPDATAAIASSTPTLDDNMCTGCHAVMDPVASTFQNWDSRGRYRPSRLYNNWHTDMLPRGYNGKIMPLANNVDSSLQWLAQQIVDDPRFARAIVKILFEGLSGQKVLPESDAAYQMQRQFLANVERLLIDSNMKLQAAIKALVKSEWWRVTDITDSEAETIYANFGSVRMLTPELLDRKIFATLGIHWLSSNQNRLTSTRSNSFRVLYGGIDSDSITKRITDPNGLMVAVQKRMANELSCRAVPLDFFREKTQRLLFPHIDKDQLPGDPALEVEVKNNIVHLHQRLLGETLTSDHSRISQSYEFLTEINFMGLADIAEDGSWQNRYLDWACGVTRHPSTGAELPDVERVSNDEQYIIRSWMALVNVLLADPKFLYE